MERELPDGPHATGAPWIEAHQPDVLCMQETKQADDKFPEKEFAALGYESAHYGDGRWNGVAIVSRVGLEDVTRGFGTSDDDHGRRVVSAVCGGTRVFCVTVTLRNSNAPIITANNYAQAEVSSCRHCSATAIAFQVVLVSKQTLAKLTAVDAALGTTNGCRTCNSLAEAFQIVYATDDASQLSLGVSYASNETASKLRALQYSGLSTAQIQIRSTALVHNLIGFLQAASRGSADTLGGPNTYGPNAYGGGGMGWTPAINGADQHAALTSNAQPIIDLMSEIQH